MKRDLLDDAIAAYRDDTHEGPSDQGLDRFEQALGARVHPTTKRRAHWLVLPLAAALLAGSAWAEATGSWHRWFGGKDELAAMPTESPAPPPRPAPQPEPTAAPLATPASRTAPPSTAAAVLPKLAPHTSAAPPASAAPVDLDVLYRDAHDAQFKRHDASAALTAWNRYLASADPSARLLLEARYNRALVLRELGRTGEARAALEPFAEGDYGAYRRDDAARLLHDMP